MYTLTRVFRDVAILPACMCLIPYGSSLISFLFSTAHHCPHRLTEKSAPRSTHELTRPRRRRKERPRTDYRRFVESFSFRTKLCRLHCSDLDSRFPWPPSSSTRPLPLNPRIRVCTHLAAGKQLRPLYMTDKFGCGGLKPNNGAPHPLRILLR
jgi:hypothetical protein